MPRVTRSQALDILINKPYLFGHAVGFDQLTPLHNEWIRIMAFGRDDGTLQAHRGSYKTTCISIAIADLMIVKPNDRIMFMRKTGGDVKEVVLQVAKILSHPVTKELAQAIWGVPLKIVKQSSGEIDTNYSRDIKGTSQLVGIGTGGSITGKHFDKIFTDDIVNVQDRVSCAERERTKLIYQELQNIKNRDGRIFNSGTPWHKDDCFSIMPEPKRYDCYATGLIPDDVLEAIKRTMLNSLFAANYELRHVAAEDVIFGNPQTGGSPEHIMQARYSHVDAAYGGEDSTAFTIANKVGDKIYVLGKLFNYHVEEAQPKIIELWTKYCCRTLHCEENSDKGYLRKEFNKQGVRAVGYHENMNKYLKIVTYLKNAWGNIVFVDGTDKAYIEQICEYNENAVHDDAPDSLATIMRLLWTKKTGAEQKHKGIEGGYLL